MLNLLSKSPGDAVTITSAIIEALPVAIYTTDAAGTLTSYNSAAAELWGCRPALRSTTWCGSFRLLELDGSPLAHDACPMAQALATAVPVRGKSAIAERPDGTRVPFLAFPTPIFDAAGRVTGAVNMLVDISDQKRIQHSLQRRIEALQALFQLSNRLQHAAALSEANDAALDAIMKALRCDRASILLFDDDGIMRFKAWRGLSDEYRAAVEGHSPWRTDTVDPQAIGISDVAIGDLDPGLLSTIEKEGIAALAFVPLVADARLVGKFMVYFNEPHEFDRDELELAMAIGRQVGVAIERVHMEVARKTAENGLRQSERRLSFALEAGKMGAWEWDIAGGTILWSPLLEEIHGLPAGAFGGTFEDFERDIHPEDRETVFDSIKRVMQAGGDYHLNYRIIRPDGEIRWLEASGKLVGSPENPERLAGVCTDVTERKRNEERIEMLMREVNHRSKNLLALVQAVAKHTASSQPDDFIDRFSERLRGLASSQDLLIEGGWRGTDLAKLIRSQLAHFQDLIGARIEVSGPPFWLCAGAAQTIGMAIHELSTNAGKYGALSNSDGSVDIRWSVAGDRFDIGWTERGGPPVREPVRRGFGHTVVSSMARLGLGAEVDLEFAATGLVWRLRCPAATAVDNQASAASP